MAIINVNLNKTVKNMKPMHGGGQPPSPTSTANYHYLTEAGIPFSRLHDVGGAFGGNRFVDVPNIFRNFDADETDPANYDFTDPDLLSMVRTLPYWLLLTMILSYLYNQCHSIIPGIVAMSVVNLVFMILSII
jgi:hypothetical protein